MIQGDKESKVGKMLSQKITQKVIIIVLTMLFSVPAFTVSNFIDEPNSQDYGLDLIRQLGPNTTAGHIAFNETI